MDGNTVPLRVITMQQLLERFYGERQGLIGTAFLRAALATIMFVIYAWHIPVHEFLWGANGQLPYDAYLRWQHGDVFALYRLSPVHWYTETLFYCSLVIAGLYAIGFAPRLTCWLFAITSYANVHRNWMATDGGATLLVLLAFLLCFADTSRYFTLFRPRGHRRWGWEIGTMLHNASRFLLMWQVCMVYFWAAFYKLGGHDWRAGTALYYTLNLQRFQVIPWLSHALAANLGVMTLGAYATLIFQMAFPFLMWNSRAKAYLVPVAVALHCNIALLLGLLSFSLTMIAADISILSDAQFRRVRFVMCMRLLAAVRATKTGTLSPRTDVR